MQNSGGFSGVEVNRIAALIEDNRDLSFFEPGMSTSTTETQSAEATRVDVTDSALTVELVDGRTVSVPLLWFPRLAHGTPEERRNWRLIGRGEGIHWPDLDEDISVAGLLAGKRSGESQHSFKRRFESRGGAH